MRQCSATPPSTIPQHHPFSISWNHISHGNDTILFYYFAFSGTFTSNNVYIAVTHIALHITWHACTYARITARTHALFSFALSKERAARSKFHSDGRCCCSHSLLQSFALDVIVDFAPRNHPMPNIFFLFFFFWFWLRNGCNYGSRFLCAHQCIHSSIWCQWWFLKSILVN